MDAKCLLSNGLKLSKRWFPLLIGLLIALVFPRFFMMESTHSARQGFTVIEVMVAIAIFGLVIAGGLIGIRRGFEVVENSRHYTRISQLLQSEAESLRTLSWDEFCALPATETLALDPVFDDAGTYDVYTVVRKITTISASLRQVDVTASFTNRQGRVLSLNYVTFVAEDGVNDYYYRTI